MPLLVNLRHLATHNLDFKGELPAAELDLETRDEMIRVEQPAAVRSGGAEAGRQPAGAGPAAR